MDYDLSWGFKPKWTEIIPFKPLSRSMKIPQSPKVFFKQWWELVGVIDMSASRRI